MQVRTMPNRHARSSPKKAAGTSREVSAQIRALRRRLAESEEMLDAIRSGQADAIVVQTPQGDQVYTLKDATHPYRVLIEAINEGVATLTRDGTVVYCNARLAAMLGLPMEQILGASFGQ